MRGVVVSTHQSEASFFSCESSKTRYVMPHSVAVWKQFEPAYGLFGYSTSPSLAYFSSRIIPGGLTYSERELLKTHVMWFVVLNDQVANLAVVWMRQMYCKNRVWRPSEALLDAWKKLGQRGFAFTFENEIDARECLLQFKVARLITWKRFSSTW